MPLSDSVLWLVTMKRKEKWLLCPSDFRDTFIHPYNASWISFDKI
jgi:hypothetical protein